MFVKQTLTLQNMLNMCLKVFDRARLKIGRVRREPLALLSVSCTHPKTDVFSPPVVTTIDLKGAMVGGLTPSRFSKRDPGLVPTC